MNYEGFITRLRNDFLRAFKSGDMPQAVLAGEKLLDIYKEKGIDNSLKYAEDIYNVAYVYSLDGKDERAITLYTTAADLIFSIDHQNERLSDVFNNLAVIYAKQYQYDTAIGYFKKSLKIRSEIFPPEHRDNIDILYNLASTYYDKGDFKKALSLYKESFGRRSDKDLECADNLNSIGYCYEKRNDYKNASKYFKDALDIITAIQGEDSTEYMNNLYYLSKAYDKAGLLTEAKLCYDKSIALIKESMGDTHPYYAEALNRLSGVYVKQGNPQRALMLRLKAVNILKKTVGTEHLFYANCLRGLGEIYAIEKDYVKAGLMYGEVMDIKKKLVGVDSEEYVADAIAMCDIYLLQDKVSKAVDLLNFIISNITIANKLYKHCLLLLVKAYSINGDGQKMYEVYDKFIKIEPDKGFDDMLADMEAM